MKKQTLIKKLLNDKAEKDNTIDLNAYANGLDAMYEALLLHDVSGSLLPLDVHKKARELSAGEFIDWWFAKLKF
jgi:hypothetical protein